MSKFVRKFSLVAFLLILIGTWIWLGNLKVNLFEFHFNRDWPIILIALGLYWLIKGLIGRRRRISGFRCDYNPYHRQDKEEIKKVLADLAEGKIDSNAASDRIRDIREKS